MSAALAPVELFSLAVDPEDDLVPALVGNGEQATFRLTMAAIDPTQAVDPKSADGGFTGAVLKIIRVPFEDDDEEDSDEEESMDLADMLDQDDSDEDAEDDEDVNGAPSDPAKSPKAKRMAALKQALAEAQAEDEMEVDGETSAKSKGKARATDEDEDEDDDDEDESDFEGSDVEGAEEFVLCTLDPAKAYQQTLDITVSEYEVVYFKVSGTHTVYLTGNILVPIGPDSDDDYDSEDEEDDYDMLEGDDMEDYLSDEDESDELDDMEDPRITEVDDEEETEAPKLVKKETGKGKNKRPAEDSSDVEPVKSAKDEVALKVDGEEKLSKNQLKKMKKKMKDNEGNAVDTSAAEKGDKKVQFAKELVQGPTGSAKTNGEASTKVNGDAAKPKASKGVKVVQGVTIDDKTVGSGPGAKKGDKVSMRYIGKLDKDKKIFDSNKKGAPFRFTLGTGEVIKGWDIGMQGIQVGGERRITVPAHHAYGSKKMDGIPANSTLVFDVKCVDIK